MSRSTFISLSTLALLLISPIGYAAGFPPLQACRFMDTMMPNPPDDSTYNHYSTDFSDSQDFMCIALEKDIGAEPTASGLVNKLQYSAEGSKTTVKHLNLALEVYNPSDIDRSLPLYNVAAGWLFKEAFHSLIPAEITNKIMAKQPFRTTHGSYTITFAREPFKNKNGGYTLNLDIQSVSSK